MSDTRSRIEAEAYAMWEGEGRPADRSGAHWLEAERAVLARLAAPVAETVEIAKAAKAAKTKAAPRRKPAARRTRKAA